MSGEDGACENREKDSSRTTQAGCGPASTSSNSGPRQVYRAVAHDRCECQFDRRMGVDDAYPGMCKARLEVPAHPSAQAASWPNSLGKCPCAHLTHSPYTKEQPIIFARFWPTITVPHYDIYISHTNGHLPGESCLTGTHTRRK